MCQTPANPTKRGDGADSEARDSKGLLLRGHSQAAALDAHVLSHLSEINLHAQGSMKVHACLGSLLARPVPGGNSVTATAIWVTAACLSPTAVAQGRTLSAPSSTTNKGLPSIMNTSDLTAPGSLMDRLASRISVACEQQRPKFRLAV